MKAAWMSAYGEDLQVGQRPTPEPAPEGVVVKVCACGVCRSDWHFWIGDWAWRLPAEFPRVPGHEISGEVVETGREVKRFRVGQRVIVPFHSGCGSCRWCAAGQANLCLEYKSFGMSFDGGFAEYVAVPQADHNLVPLPEQIGLEAAAALGCRFMTAWHGLADRLALSPGSTLAVFGCGGLGLSVIMIARLLDLRVIAVDPSAKAREQALALGAVAALPGGADTPADLVERTGGGVDGTVDALGLGLTCLPALESLRRGGRHLQLGITGAQERGVLSLPIDRITKMELALLGSLGCPRASYSRLLEQVAAGRLRPQELISERHGLEGAGGLLQRMSTFATDGVCLVKPG